MGRTLGALSFSFLIACATDPAVPRETYGDVHAAPAESFTAPVTSAADAFNCTMSALSADVYTITTANHGLIVATRGIDKLSITFYDDPVTKRPTMSIVGAPVYQAPDDGTRARGGVGNSLAAIVAVQSANAEHEQQVNRLNANKRQILRTCGLSE